MILKIDNYKEGTAVKLVTLTINYKVTAKRTETMKFQRVKANV